MERRPQMRTWMVLALIAVLASTPACATVDTATEIETRDDARALANLYDSICAVTVKVLVMCDVDDAIISTHGTGVIVGREGNTYAVVTNKHVVDVPGGFPYARRVYHNIEHPVIGNMSARVLATDAERDLACLTFECEADLPVARFSPEVPPLLSEVYHYGFGGFWYKGAFATKGIFSSKSRVWASLPCAWTVTCNVWYGCSGGGVFTSSGRLMGITCVMDIERQAYLPWLVGVVPYSELQSFLQAAGF
jgi:S1-C subfamily serine protease